MKFTQAGYRMVMVTHCRDKNEIMVKVILNHAIESYEFPCISFNKVYINFRKAKAAIRESPPMVHHSTVNPACWASCAPPTGPRV